MRKISPNHPVMAAAQGQKALSKNHQNNTVNHLNLSKMPKMYENIRNAYVKDGKSYDEAQSIAAATYNKYRKSHPSAEKLSNKPEVKVKLRVKKKSQK
jgi:hypothetical protein